MAFSPNGKQVVSGSWDKSLKVWNAETGTELSTLTVDSGFRGVQSVSFSPIGDMIAAGCYNGKIYFIDAQSGEVKRALTGHSDQVSSVAFSADGQWVMSGSNDKTIRLWDTNL